MVWYASMPGQDSLLKALTHTLSGGALEALGVRGVETLEPFTTELPASTLRMDRAWRMANGDVFHLEFQDRRERTLHRFLEYDARLANQVKARIRTVVLYHAQVASAPQELDIGTAIYRVENVFLSALDGDGALDEVEAHLRVRRWEPADRLRLGLALSMRVEDRHQAMARVLNLLPRVPDDEERELVASAVLAFGDRALSDEDRRKLRKELKNVFRMAEELYEDGRHDGKQQAAEDIAHRLLAEGVPVDVVEKATGLPRERLEQMQREVH
ncbi:hypothetical protein [Alicyclobacillus mali (ex Roth et al. 2021)]|uniref:hypothetical protein n=1 Tax=Alicyclobacillus mali (ex Roth et al. 2021) TaxID=1123961 RepID=UPI00324260D2